MVRRCFLASLSMLVLFLSVNYGQAFGETQITEQEARQDTEDIFKLMDIFFKLQSEGKIPGLGKKGKHGNASGYKIRDNVRREPFVDKSMLFDLKECNNLYLVDVKLGNEEIMKCFFCMENSIFTLISAYKQYDNKWIRIKQEK